MQSQFVPHDAPIDLTNCDREPIHAPGTVQPHGALFALDDSTERVLAASANAERFTGEPLTQTINALATDVFGAAGADALRNAALALKSGGSPVSVRLPKSGHAALMHRAAQTVFVEIEAAEEAGILADPLDLIRDVVRDLTEFDDLQRLCDTGAAELRALTGYDRVMVYRFDPEGHGKVVAEARHDSLEVYLGRHYPASDIPRQARALYRTTMLRLIVDVNAQAAALVPLLDPRTAGEWDLGRAILRSTSPIHLEYLRNMGVSATMTISLLRGGELWGLIACHHYTPKFVAHDVRAAAAIVGHALVARIVALEDARIAAARFAVQDAVIALVMNASGDRRAALATAANFNDALGIHGACLTGAAPAAFGRTLTPERLEALIAWLSERGGSDVFVTDSLAKANPAFTDVADVASGVYARRYGPVWYCAFRGEHQHFIDWGGDPLKPVDVENGRLTPRGSFALWREEVRHRAEPWEPWTIDALDRAAQWAAGRGPG